MGKYEVYVEETHYFKTEVEANSSEQAMDIFYDWQLDGQIQPYDISLSYNYAIRVEDA